MPAHESDDSDSSRVGPGRVRELFINCGDSFCGVLLYRGAMSEPTSMNPPAAEWLEMLLSYLWEQRGTDLHLTAGSPPLARVDGELHAVPNQPVPKPADTDAFADALLDEADRATFEERGDVDFAFGFDHLARIRGSAYAQRGS